MKEKWDMWVLLEKNHKSKKWLDGQQKDETKKILFFFLSIRFSQIHENLTVGIRRAKNKKCSTRRGLCVGTKKTRFHLEFR